MSEPNVITPGLRVRPLLLPLALGTLAAWLAVATVAGIAAMFGSSIVKDDAGRPITGLAGLGSALVIGAIMGALAAAIGCLGLPLGLRLYEWRERTRAATAARGARAS